MQKHEKHETHERHEPKHAHPEEAKEPTKAPETESAFETFDGDLALQYIQAGGRCVSITARYPSAHPDYPTMKPGKRYRFLESKTTLDQLLAASQQEAA